MWIHFRTQLIYNSTVVVVFLPQMLGILLPVIDRLVAFWTMPVTVPFVIVQSPVGEILAFTAADKVIIYF